MGPGRQPQRAWVPFVGNHAVTGGPFSKFARQNTIKTAVAETDHPLKAFDLVIFAFTKDHQQNSNLPSDIWCYFEVFSAALRYLCRFK
jgi:hypothetical protein